MISARCSIAKQCIYLQFERAAHLFHDPKVYKTPEELANIPKVVFSGIQPTGNPHLGNYLGAIRQWVNLQNNQEFEKRIFSVVDLHALTTEVNPNILRDNIQKMIMSLLACGLDPEKNIIFHQSQILEHTSLAWLFMSMAPFNKMTQLIQWKEKKKNFRTSGNIALFSYPVLQAADILLYKATHVPVGEDQTQHIHVTRELARRFNILYGEYYEMVEVLSTRACRVKSLQNPYNKMSKSDQSDRSRINILDPSDVIRKKIRKALSDTESFISYEEIRRPGVSNLINIYSEVTGESVENIVATFENKTVESLKNAVAEVVIELLNPIREEYYKLENDPQYAINILQNGNEKAQKIASKNWNEIKKLAGLS